MLNILKQYLNNRNECFSVSLSLCPSLPQEHGCILFENVRGSGSRKTGVSQPLVTISSKGQESKHWTLNGGMQKEVLCSCSLTAMWAIQAGECTTGRPFLPCISLMSSARGGVGSERAGRPGGEGGGERREVLFKISCSAPAPTVCR